MDNNQFDNLNNIDNNEVSIKNNSNTNSTPDTLESASARPEAEVASVNANEQGSNAANNATAEPIANIPRTETLRSEAPRAEVLNSEAPRTEAPREAAAAPRASGYAGESGYGAGSAPDFSKYRDAASSFAHVPHETVYINNQESKKAKKAKKVNAPKGRLGFGTVAVLLVVCLLVSGAAGFGGAMLANGFSGSPAVGDPGMPSNASPSVVFQSFANQNRTPGTYEQVAEAVSPSVVVITTESVTTDNFWGGSYVVSGAGSGVIISADGLIITNNHVVSGASNIKVNLSDGSDYTAKVIGTDPDSDIAVIKVDGVNLPFALVGNSDELTVGEEVIAVGNPLGEFGGSVTNGIISGLSRNVRIGGADMKLIQTNTAVNPGNSGGGLFNLYGELIGIVNAKSSSSSSGTTVEGIGFAIPINDATKVATELMNFGYVRGKVMLGITYVDIDNSWTAMSYGVNALGVYVVSTEFEENEFKPGDRIVAIDDKAVEYSSDIKSAIKDYKVGDVITVKVVRNGQYQDVKVTLHEYVPNTAKEESAFGEKNSNNNISG